MSRTNWNFYGIGGWEVTTEQAVSPTHGFRSVSGYQQIIYNGNTSILNARIVFSLKVTEYHPGLSPYWGFGAIARSAIPAEFGTTFYFAAMRGVSANEVGFSLGKYKAGVWGYFGGGVGTVVPAGTGFSGWHKYRFSVTDEFGESVLRVDYWNVNTTAWVQWFQCADSGAGRIDAAGGAGLYQHMGTYPAGTAFFDDVSVIELT